MRTTVPASGDAGASASAEGERAWRRARRRRVISVSLAVVAALVGAHGLAVGNRLEVVVAVAPALAAWWSRPDPDPARWDRGATGEAATAALLHRLPKGFVVLHDRRQPGSRGNIDHLVVGPSGVWVVDSKARRARLRVRRRQVWAGGYPIDVEPVRRQAAAVEAALGVAVRAVVAVHGHGLRRRGKKIQAVLVLPAGRLVRVLRRRGRRRRTAVGSLAATAERRFPPAVGAEFAATGGRRQSGSAPR
ncbi:MAG TPA: nuclease-related domain-containing protein [Acidimicrobiales bacterium]|nr:nuclease-related domain-containing protein [Acidimicrobiales bacterium]